MKLSFQAQHEMSVRQQNVSVALSAVDVPRRISNSKEVIYLFKIKQQEHTKGYVCTMDI